MRGSCPPAMGSLDLRKSRRMIRRMRLVVPRWMRLLAKGWVQKVARVRQAATKGKKKQFTQRSGPNMKPQRLTNDWEDNDLPVYPGGPPQLEGDGIVWVKGRAVVDDPGDERL